MLRALAFAPGEAVNGREGWRGQRAGAWGLALASLPWLLLGCGPSAIRTGQALSLPSGAPQGTCERQGFYELAPARITTHAATAGVTYTDLYQADFNGLGVFRPGSNQPEELEDVWPRLNEPRLQQLHEARIEPVDAASRRSLYWALGGLVGLAGGIAGAAALGDSHQEAAAVVGISGLAMGVVGVVGALVAQPSGQEELAADARRKLFFFPEDDRAAVLRGVDRHNLATHSHCAR